MDSSRPHLSIAGLKSRISFRKSGQNRPKHAQTSLVACINFFSQVYIYTPIYRSSRYIEVFLKSQLFSSITYMKIPFIYRSYIYRSSQYIEVFLHRQMSIYTLIHHSYIEYRLPVQISRGSIVKVYRTFLSPIVRTKAPPKIPASAQTNDC